jgi:hypothetical protein
LRWALWAIGLAHCTSFLIVSIDAGVVQHLKHI